MRLEHYLEANYILRQDAAFALGISPARITFLCSPEAWPASRDLARRIQVWTKGAVTPNDFLPRLKKPKPKPRRKKDG